MTCAMASVRWGVKFSFGLGILLSLGKGRRKKGLDYVDIEPIQGEGD